MLIYRLCCVPSPPPERKGITFGDNTLFRSLRQSCWESKPPKVRRKKTKKRAILSDLGDNSNNCSRRLKGYPNRTKQMPCTAKKKCACYLKSVKFLARVCLQRGRWPCKQHGFPACCRAFSFLVFERLATDDDGGCLDDSLQSASGCLDPDDEHAPSLCQRTWAKRSFPTDNKKRSAKVDRSWEENLQFWYHKCCDCRNHVLFGQP